MKRTIDVNGVKVDFAVSAALPRLYRLQCGRDIFRDMKAIAGAVGAKFEARDAQLELDTLTTFENLAYCMAYAAHPDTTPESAEAWLDTLPALPIMSVFPQIELLWLQNLAQLETPTKK